MKKTIKKLLLLLPLLVLFTGCSEEVYEEKMYEANFETKVNYVNINQVPFLIPSIQKFNPDYGYLSNASSPSNKETLNLNLDLDRILEYVYANGLKSYSIIIKKEFTEYEDKYLENLHIYEKEGEYESIIFRYNSINDTQEFDKSTFTGELTAYDLDGNMIGIGQIENGFSKITLIIQIGCFKIYYLSNAGEYCVKNDCEEEDGTGGGGGGDSSSGGSGSSGAGGDSGSSGSGSSGSSGDTGGTGGVMGGGGVTVDILPNAPATSYTNAQTAFLSSLSNFAEDNFFNLTSSTQNIVLGYVDNPNNQPYVNAVSSYINNNNSILTWMSEQSEQTQNQIFNYLTENNFSQQSQAFVGEIRDYVDSNNNSNESTEEVNAILDILDDGNVGGAPVVVAPDIPINNMTDYLGCFNTSQGATITIYADQPIEGSHSIISLSESVGHSFISITQGNNVATLGFYPQSSVASIIPNSFSLDPRDFVSVPGVFGNNQGHVFDVSLSTSVNAAGLTNIINGFISMAQNNPLYNLGSLNCTDIAIIVFESNTNIDIPSCESPTPWSGQTPGTLGEVIRNMPTPPGAIKNTNGGYAPNNNCN